MKLRQATINKIMQLHGLGIAEREAEKAGNHSQAKGFNDQAGKIFRKLMIDIERDLCLNPDPEFDGLTQDHLEKFSDELSVIPHSMLWVIGNGEWC